jgi:AcrR family transcriptional regulator
MVRSAASLIGSRGVSATSFSDVVSDSGAPRGSIYHHFPDGKKQLAEEAVRWVSERVLDYQRRCSAGATPAEILSWFVALWRQVVVNSNGASGCVVAGVAIDTVADDAELMEVVRSSFRDWVDLLAVQLKAAGMTSARAKSIALATLAGMEGALILCRAEGNVKPLDAVAKELLRLVDGTRPSTSSG